MSDIKSVHLQNFPDINNFNVNRQLMDTMDKIRAICSCALFIRDKNNLRVRLPLNKITIISKNTNDIKEFSNIILDEINVKNIEFVENIDDFSSNKLILDFKKIGPKIGNKMPYLIKATKNNEWAIKNNQLIICDFTLDNNEFKLVLEPKKENVFVVDNYNILIQLDLNITEELEQEGTARDLIRIIQQLRKDANLKLVDKIDLSIYTENNYLSKSIENFKGYISEQTLAKSLNIFPNKKISSNFDGFLFNEILNDNKITITFKVIN